MTTDAGHPYQGRIEVLAKTAFGIVFTEAGNETTVLKGMSVWLDGVEFDRRPAVIPGVLEREATIYKALGDHPRITKCYGLEFIPTTAAAAGPGPFVPNGGGSPLNHSLALRLERAPLGSLRQLIVETPAYEKPSVAFRLAVALDFAEGVCRLHERKVLWADLSTRNALVFDGYRVKLCDFGGAFLDGTRYAPVRAYETRYEPPRRHAGRYGGHGGGGGGGFQAPMLAGEIFALGSAIYEITEWEVPYGPAVSERDVAVKLSRGELPVLSEDNPARAVIRRCWSAYTSAQRVPGWNGTALAYEAWCALKQVAEQHGP
ncbi:kinase-like domain-containing protein [Lasiosphaeria hispida]|uniref:Kinase-like domain-containing protein n=1 Tax=Lasiosphaeria hispida TaxID=260671 RepID=A0AAJ0HCR2_9PEZI|nr:kinase-like domain-containing protein [Lasiosphaeria hispida]